MVTPDFISALVARPYEQPQFRNIVSLRKSEDLFDDLSDSPGDQALAQAIEMHHKPFTYKSHQPIIGRPFEEAEWTNAIGFPFQHLSASRYSAGSFGVWYGADMVETTVYETTYHWRNQFLADAGFTQEGIAIHRKVYAVQLRGLLVDLRPLIASYPDLVHPSSYTFAQSVGAHFSDRKYPGLISQSARCDGAITALFDPAPLSDPRAHCFLTYRTTDKGINVERENGKTLMQIN